MSMVPEHPARRPEGRLRRAEGRGARRLPPQQVPAQKPEQRLNIDTVGLQPRGGDGLGLLGMRESTGPCPTPTNGPTSHHQVHAGSIATDTPARKSAKKRSIRSGSFANRCCVSFYSSVITAIRGIRHCRTKPTCERTSVLQARQEANVHMTARKPVEGKSERARPQRGRYPPPTPEKPKINPHPDFGAEFRNRPTSPPSLPRRCGMSSGDWGLWCRGSAPG